MDKPPFSVLMSLYDKESEENLIDALDSIFNQTLLPAEVILVIDGPIKRSLTNIVLKYNVKTIPLKKNIGLGGALRIGLEECQYELIARMDTDDICYHNRFEKQLAFMKDHPEVSVVGTSLQEFRTKPGDLNRFRQSPIGYEQLRKYAKYRNPLNHPTVVFRKSSVKSVGSYMDMPLFEDYYLWIRMLNAGLVIENLKECLLHFRIGNDMIGRRHGYSYMIKEFSFLKSIRALGFFENGVFFKSVIMKLPLRLLPRKVLALIYKKLLR